MYNNNIEKKFTNTLVTGKSILDLKDKKKSIYTENITNNKIYNTIVKLNEKNNEKK
jgi:hypothetical protein